MILIIRMAMEIISKEIKKKKEKRKLLEGIDLKSGMLLVVENGLVKSWMFPKKIY